MHVTAVVEDEAQALLRIPLRDPPGDSKPTKHEPVKRQLTDAGYEPSKRVLCRCVITTFIPSTQAEYQPSSELMDAIDSLIQEQDGEKKPAVREGPSMTEPWSGPCT